MEWLKKIKVIIFDMDGTLYQDYTFLGRYVRHLLQDVLPQETIESKVREAYAILEGNHIARLGYFYNRENQTVYAHQNMQLTKSFQWNGEENEDLDQQLEQLSYIGDPWGIAMLYAIQHGIDEQKRMRAFHQVREEMLTDPYEIFCHHPLFVAISKLHVEKKILMTNTPEPSGPEFVKHLNIEQLFDEYVYGAEKPYGIQSTVERLLKEGYAAHEILSIGDNPWNDLHPVKKSGGKTCLITKYAYSDPTEWDISVRTIEELTEFLQGQAELHLVQAH
ncbi:HAD family hydrolase [Sporosarcina soli]|uniref:HAD family hydrolase n=1 Tax=Sporosarcina soli TaxID=334736 RepID=A0ABW0TQS9_9BACL